MGPHPPLRKVLTFKDESSIQNVLEALLQAVGNHTTLALSTDPALTLLSQNQFDAVLLDLRAVPRPQTECAVTELRASLVGRVIVITAAVSDRKTLEMFERCSAPRRARQGVTGHLWGRLRTLLNSAF